VHFDARQQPAHPQDARQRARAEPDVLGEQPVEVAVAHAERRVGVRDRADRVRRELPTGRDR
jgi:hypothetical protein